jgi:hypothetical protein
MGGRGYEFMRMELSHEVALLIWEPIVVGWSSSFV